MDAAGATVPTFHEVRERIVARYPALTPQLKTIAQFALSNPDQMAVDTVAQLGARLNVPGSSIVRFAQVMGYSGFLEMKKVFSAHLIYRAQAMEHEPQVGDATMGWAARATADARRSLNALEQEFDAQAFRRGVRTLACARMVFVAAQHRSFAAAALFTWRSIEGDRQCVLLDNVGGYALPQSRLAGPQDATLAISFSPYQPSVIQAAQTHRETGGAVVAITDTPLSPLAPHADTLLLVPGGASVGVAVLVEALAGAMAEYATGGEESSARPTDHLNDVRSPNAQD